MSIVRIFFELQFRVLFGFLRNSRNRKKAIATLQLLTYKFNVLRLQLSSKSSSLTQGRGYILKFCEILKKYSCKSNQEPVKHFRSPWFLLIHLIGT